MSATMPKSGYAANWPSVIAGGLLLAILACLIAEAPWAAADALTARATLPVAPAFGVDATLLLAGVLPGERALSAVSWLGLPLLAAAVVSAERWSLRSALILAAASMNPLALHAFSSGWGLGVPALFLVATRLEALPARPVHVGLPLLGGAAFLAAAAVPGAASLALPLFAVLFLAAPPPWAAGTMRTVYLTVFLMPAAWFGALAYLGWQTGHAALPMAPPVGTDIWHFVLGASLAAISAPGLLSGARVRPAGAAILGLAALAFIADGVPFVAGPLLAGFGQLAAARRLGGAKQVLWCLLGVAGTASSVWLLA